MMAKRPPFRRPYKVTATMAHTATNQTAGKGWVAWSTRHLRLFGEQSMSRRDDPLNAIGYGWDIRRLTEPVHDKEVDSRSRARYEGC